MRVHACQDLSWKQDTFFVKEMLKTTLKLKFDFFLSLSIRMCHILPYSRCTIPFESHLSLIICNSIIVIIGHNTFRVDLLVLEYGIIQQNLDEKFHNISARFEWFWSLWILYALSTFMGFGIYWLLSICEIFSLDNVEVV